MVFVPERAEMNIYTMHVCPSFFLNVVIIIVWPHMYKDFKKFRERCGGILEL